MFNVVTTSLTGLFFLVIEGCTAIGFVVGLSIDNSNATTDTLGVQKCSESELQKGEPAVVLTKDSAVVSGVFLGNENASTEVYLMQYSDWHTRRTSPLFSVGLGDSITVTLNSDKNRRLAGEFAGFAETSIKIRRDVGPPYNVVVGSVNLKYVETVYDHRANSWGGAVLLSAIDSGDIPIPRQLVFARGADSIRIPSHMVLRIGRPVTSKNVPAAGRVTGAVIGLLVDAVVVAISFNQWKWTGKM